MSFLFRVVLVHAPLQRLLLLNPKPRSGSIPTPWMSVCCKDTRVCDTGYPFCQIRLLSRFSLLVTCVGCLEIEDSSFIPFSTMED